MFRFCFSTKHYKNNIFQLKKSTLLVFYIMHSLYSFKNFNNNWHMLEIIQLIFLIDIALGYMCFLRRLTHYFSINYVYIFKKKTFSPFRNFAYHLCSIIIFFVVINSLLATIKTIL